MQLSAEFPDKRLTAKKRKGGMKSKGGLKMSQKPVGYKITLKSKKVAVFREPEIQDEATATSLAANKADGSNAYALMPHLLVEMAKLLLVSVDGKKLGAKDKENLQGLFSYQDWQEVKAFIGELIGQGAESPKLEMVSLDETAES